MLYITSHTHYEIVGLAVNEALGARAEQQQTLEHIKRIWHILQETRLWPNSHLIFPSCCWSQRFSITVASRLAQRTIARLIREVLISQEEGERSKGRELREWEEQSPNQITQILAQSPAVDELLKRDRSYPWYTQNSARLRLVQTSQLGRLNLSSIVALIERQQQQQRIAKERQLIQQQERQHNLDLLGHESNPALKKTIEDMPGLFYPRPYSTPPQPEGYCSTWKPLRARLPDLGWPRRQQRHPVTISSS